ncbi:MAG: hypothetical protein J6T10_25930 [Methanobrevibacter sp.]|nr:hypothetical protein [Methanobrevibacter sp.]
MNIETIATYLENRYTKTDKQTAKWLNSKTLSMLCKTNVISFTDYFRLSIFNCELYNYKGV